jgi:hypothetical protein
MEATSRLRERLRTLLLPLSIALGSAACDGGPTGPSPFEFPDRLYAMRFEAPTFQPGLLAGQDEWFAALGPEAANILPRATRAPKEGSSSLQIEGSRLQELQGFHFGSYARPLNYAPIGKEMPRVNLQGWVGLTVTGDDGPSCGCGLGLTGPLGGDPVPNILIGIQKREGSYVSYLSNYDGEIVYGPVYNPGSWVHVRAVLDFERRAVQGYVNGVSIGEVAFTRGIGDEITYMNISLGSNQPIPGVNSYFDGVLVAAGPRLRD